MFQVKKYDRIFSFITDPSITLSGTHNEIEFCVFFFWDKYITTFFVTTDNITELLQTFIYNSKRKIKQEEKNIFW